LLQPAKEFPGAETVAFRKAPTGVPKIGVTSVWRPAWLKQLRILLSNLTATLFWPHQGTADKKAEFKVLLCQGTEQRPGNMPTAIPIFE